MWNSEETRQLAAAYQTLCEDMAALFGTLTSLEIGLEACKQSILKAVTTGCDLGMCLEQLYLKYPATDIPSETTKLETCKITLPKSERRETYIDTRGINGQSNKEVPRQDNRQTEASGDDGATD